MPFGRSPTLPIDFLGSGVSPTLTVWSLGVGVYLSASSLGTAVNESSAKAEWRSSVFSP